MERFQKPLVALIFVFGAIVLAAMFSDMWYSRRGTEPNSLDNPQVLRVYAVPTERAQDIRTALAATLDNGGAKTAPLGRVMLSGTNQLVVLAPLSTQESIRRAILELAGEGPAEQAATQVSQAVRLDVWVVDVAAGEPGDEAALAPLAEALAAAKPTIGAGPFRLADSLVVSTIPNGGNAHVESGRGTRVGASLRPAAGGLLAEIDITGDGPGHINTTTKLPFGKFVVLAQVAAPGDGGAPRLYIVRAEPVAG